MNKRCVTNFSFIQYWHTSWLDTPLGDPILTRLGKPQWEPQWETQTTYCAQILLPHLCRSVAVQHFILSDNVFHEVLDKILSNDKRITKPQQAYANTNSNYNHNYNESSVPLITNSTPTTEKRKPTPINPNNETTKEHQAPHAENGAENDFVRLSDGIQNTNGKSGSPWPMERKQKSYTSTLIAAKDCSP